MYTNPLIIHACLALNQKNSSVRRVQRGADGQGDTQQPLNICLPKSGTACTFVCLCVCARAQANVDCIYTISMISM